LARMRIRAEGKGGEDDKLTDALAQKHFYR